MKHCDKCSVAVRGNETFCPLCQNRLSGTDHEKIYPEVPTIYKQHTLFFKMLIFFTVVAGVSSVAVNLVFPHHGYWFGFVLLGILCFWISIAYVVRIKENIAKDITVWVVIISLLFVVWDWLTGWQGWSLNFAFPITCSSAMVLLAVIANVLNLQGEDYIIYLMVDILFGVVPYIFFLNGLITIFIPSFICIALSIISICALILLEGRNILHEIQKILHL